nr:MAG: VP1 protein [Narnaviridae sp. 2]
MDIPMTTSILRNQRISSFTDQMSWDVEAVKRSYTVNEQATVSTSTNSPTGSHLFKFIERTVPSRQRNRGIKDRFPLSSSLDVLCASTKETIHLKSTFSTLKVFGLSWRENESRKRILRILLKLFSIESIKDSILTSIKFTDIISKLPGSFDIRCCTTYDLTHPKWSINVEATMSIRNSASTQFQRSGKRNSEFLGELYSRKSTSVDNFRKVLPLATGKALVDLGVPSAHMSKKRTSVINRWVQKTGQWKIIKDLNGTYDVPVGKLVMNFRPQTVSIMPRENFFMSIKDKCSLDEDASIFGRNRLTWINLKSQNSHHIKIDAWIIKNPDEIVAPNNVWISSMTRHFNCKSMQQTKSQEGQRGSHMNSTFCFNNRTVREQKIHRRKHLNDVIFDPRIDIQSIHNASPKSLSINMWYIVRCIGQVGRKARTGLIKAVFEEIIQLLLVADTVCVHPVFFFKKMPNLATNDIAWKQRKSRKFAKHTCFVTLLGHCYNFAGNSFGSTVFNSCLNYYFIKQRTTLCQWHKFEQRLKNFACITDKFCKSATIRTREVKRCAVFIRRPRHIVSNTSLLDVILRPFINSVGYFKINIFTWSRYYLLIRSDSFIYHLLVSKWERSTESSHLRSSLRIRTYAFKLTYERIWKGRFTTGPFSIYSPEAETVSQEFNLFANHMFLPRQNFIHEPSSKSDRRSKIRHLTRRTTSEITTSHCRPDPLTKLYVQQRVGRASREIPNLLHGGNRPTPGILR